MPSSKMIVEILLKKMYLQWHQVIQKTRYNDKIPSTTNGQSFGKASSTWKDINLVGEFFFGIISFKHGNGKQIVFWHDS